MDDINFDEDTTLINETRQPYRSHRPNTERHDPRLYGSESSLQPESDTPVSVLDIDAAMTSMEEPSLGPSFNEVVGGTSTASSRRMHSSGTTGGFQGPGMHYHRRTESAPEMEVVDRSRFGFPRLGSNPAMAIKEEEEGEDEEDGMNASLATRNATSDSRGVHESPDEQDAELSVNIIEAEGIDDEPVRKSRQWQTSAAIMSREQAPGETRPDYDDEVGYIEVVEAHEEPRFSMITKSSDESTITPTLQDHLDTHPTSRSFNFPISTSTFGSTTSGIPSSVSSPDFSKTSFDGPRMHTAASSITDRMTLSSSRAGDHSSGVHSSVDDVPSLTSSASTMSAHPPRFSISDRSTADRSSSLSAAVLPRTQNSTAHKRLSLASLSRLTGGSYSRSKLNIEETAPIENVERTEKKKGKRISRLMKFWKPKDKLPIP